MSWTAPTLRSTGDLITASIYNTDLVNNLLFLKTPIDNNGHLIYGVTQQTKSSTYSVAVTDDTIFVSGTFTLTLYTPVGNAGKRVTVKKTDSGTTTTVATAAGSIDGQSTQAMTVQYLSLTFESDGTNWNIV